MASRADGVPLIIDGTGAARSLERVSFEDRLVYESNLQQLLDECPELLPLSQIDSTLGSPVSIGREVETSVGYIDNLFITPAGQLVIVETKLWRNPEARREVVGQIIDYAKDLANWSYEDLDGIALEHTEQSLWDLVGHTGDEAAFVDTVSRFLRQGRFVLLVVGDGIREEVEQMADYLSDAPQLQFTLSLVEMRLWQHDDQLLVTPSVVARTREVTRAVVEVRTLGEASVDIDVSLPVEPEQATGRRPVDPDVTARFHELSRLGRERHGLPGIRSGATYKAGSGWLWYPAETFEDAWLRAELTDGTVSVGVRDDDLGQQALIDLYSRDARPGFEVREAGKSVAIRATSRGGPVDPDVPLDLQPGAVDAILETVADMRDWWASDGLPRLQAARDE